MSTLYRIACAPTQKPYRIGLLFTQGSLISARFLQRSDAAPLRSWKWIVTYRIGLGRFCSHYVEVFFMSARKAIRYSVDKALMVAGVEEKFLSSSLYLMTCSLIIFGSAGCMGRITCVRRASDNATNLISVVQFLIRRNIFTGSRSQELYVKNIWGKVHLEYL